MTELEAVKGVGPAVAKKLREGFITSAELLAVQNPVDIEALKIGEETARKIVDAARDQIGGFGFVSGIDVEREMMERQRLSTGSEKLDGLLLGGIEQGSIVEIFGPWRGGKTQWCNTLATMVQLPADQGGLDGRVLWMDTESSFKPWQIRAMAKRRGLDPDIALGNIGRADVATSNQMLKLFKNIPTMCAEQDYKLVIVDSFTGLFRVEYTEFSNLKTRQVIMNKLLSKMRRAGMATDAIFVVTNQVTTGISTFGPGNPNKPVGGHIIAHGTDYRLYARRVKEDLRKIALQDNAGIPEFEMDVRIGWGGFYESAKEKESKEESIIEYLDSIGITKKQRESLKKGDTKE